MQQICGQLNDGGEPCCTIRSKLQENGERLLLTKRTRQGYVPPPAQPTIQAQQVQQAQQAPTSPPPVDYNTHSRFNENGVRVMQPVRLTVQSAPTVAPAQPPVQPPVLNETPQPTQPTQQHHQPPGSHPSPHTASPSAAVRKPAHYEDVPDEIWEIMYELPFRVKYEVEVLVGLDKLMRWKFLPLDFLQLLDACNSQEGEAVCVAALRTMATLKLGRLSVDIFNDARQQAIGRMRSGGLTRQPGQSGQESVVMQRSVEVLSCHYCCPSGVTKVRAAEYQSSNRVLRLLGGFCGTDSLLRVSFVNEGTYTVSDAGIKPRTSQAAC